MTSATQLRSDFDNFVTAYGQKVRLKFYVSTTSGAVYDDEITLTASGNSVWCYGRQNALQSNTGGADFKLLQQGAIVLDDSIIYLPGSVSSAGSINNYTKIGIGSPTPSEYAMVASVGDIPFYVGSEIVYHKLYIRKLNTGSFIGEA